MSDAIQILGVSGFLLFSIGLFLGFAIPAVRNPRMGLSAHLTAAQTGPALTAFALFWDHLSVPASLSSLLAFTLVGSSYALVAGITLAAVFGASEALPIAGGTHRASKTREAIVSVLVKGSSIAMALTVATISFFSLQGIL